MEKIETTISDRYEDYSILKYLKIIQPNWTKVFAIKMIRTRNVLVNGKRTSMDYRLKAGDTIRLYGYSQKIENLKLERLNGLKVIHETEHIIIVNKPVGVTVQADGENLFNNMNNQLLKHLGWKESERQEKWKPVFVHRLDRNTSGLLMGAKTYEGQKSLDRAIRSQKIHKYYRARVHGLVPFKEKTIRSHLLKLPGENRVIISAPNRRGSKEAISEVRLIKHLMENRESLLEIRLITGRTHQIRVHLSQLGHPIRGDRKYGKETERKKYPHPDLVAYRLIFDESIEGKVLEELKGREFSLGSH